MSLPKYPILLPSAVAQSGDRADIPTVASTGEFSYTSGFPSATQTPLSAGGVPPRRIDFNGILHELSQHTFYQQSGGMYAWNAELDYPLNAVVYGANNELYQATQNSGVNYEVGAKDPTLNGGYWKRLSVSLSNAINSSSTTTAATSSAVKTAYDRGSTALTEAQKATSKAYVNDTNNSSYIKFSNGLIMQWGVFRHTSNGAQTITFPTPFTSASNISVQLTLRPSQGTGHIDRDYSAYFQATNITTTNFKHYGSTTSTLADTISWFAIGS